MRKQLFISVFNCAGISYQEMSANGKTIFGSSVIICLYVIAF